MQISDTFSKLKWLTVDKFEADTTVSEKINRLANNVVFGASLYGLYAFATGGTGVAVYASYLSMGLAARKIASTTVGYLVYPAAFTSFPRAAGAAVGKLATKLTGNPAVADIIGFLIRGREYYAEYGINEMKSLESKGFIARKISLYKSGTKYDAIIITHPDTINNGNWTIHALGNGMTMESKIVNNAKSNFANKCNTLLVNGPSVSQSGGWPTRYQMGAGFEAGIKFLEREVKATHIIMHGFSLGGGMMGEAILNHDFTYGMKKDIKYLSIADRSFSRLSTIAGILVGQLVEPIIHFTGSEIDGVGAAQKLSLLGIRQILIQHASPESAGSDCEIPDKASLAYELHKDTTLTDKIFLESVSIRHNGPLPSVIEASLKDQIKKFVENL
jgi:hypothetical protein